MSTWKKELSFVIIICGIVGTIIGLFYVNTAGGFGPLNIGTIIGLVLGVVIGVIFKNRSTKKMWKGVLIGGLVGLVLVFLQDIIHTIIGNNLYNIISRGGGMGGFFVFGIYIIIFSAFIGALIGLLKKSK